MGTILIYTTMTMAITQRRPVISMLRAIGGRRATIVRDMVAEAAILGLIGGAVGSGLGILMGRVAIGRLPPAVTQGLEARVEYWLPTYAIPAAIAVTALAECGRVGDGGAPGVQGLADRGAGTRRGFRGGLCCRDGCASPAGWAPSRCSRRRS